VVDAGVGQDRVDEGQVAVGQRRGVFDGLQLGLDGVCLVVALAELGGEAVPD